MATKQGVSLTYNSRYTAHSVMYVMHTNGDMRDASELPIEKAALSKGHLNKLIK